MQPRNLELARSRKRNGSVTSGEASNFARTFFRLLRESVRSGGATVACVSPADPIPDGLAFARWDGRPGFAPVCYFGPAVSYLDVDAAMLAVTVAAKTPDDRAVARLNPTGVGRRLSVANYLITTPSSDSTPENPHYNIMGRKTLGELPRRIWTIATAKLIDRLDPPPGASHHPEPENTRRLPLTVYRPLARPDQSVINPTQTEPPSPPADNGKAVSQELVLERRTRRTREEFLAEASRALLAIADGINDVVGGKDQPTVPESVEEYARAAMALYGWSRVETARKLNEAAIAVVSEPTPSTLFEKMENGNLERPDR